MNGILLAAALSVTSTPQFQTTLDRMRTEQQVPGISAVITVADQIIYAGASGVADLETDRPMTADTAVYAGSLSKIFTAVLILRLVEQSKLSLHQPVSGIATQSGDAAPGITLAHLLTHASGLTREGNFDYWFTGLFPDRATLSSYLCNAKLQQPPGTSLNYSNVGYAKLGLVIEEVTGQPYNEVLHSQLLVPLGMTSSGTSGPTADIARGYTPTGRFLPDQQHPFAGVGQKVGNRYLREYHDANAMAPAFGIYTSAMDMARLTRFLLGYGNTQVLSTEMRERMRTRQPSGWGMGLKLDTLNGRSVARHEGWFAAHRSHLLLDIDAKLSVVVLTNSDSGEPAKIAEKLHEAVIGKWLEE